MNKFFILILIAAWLFLNACKKDEPKINEIDNEKLDVSTDDVFEKQKENNDRINSYDEFISRNYPEVFNEKIKSGNFVYSPYSYKMALEGVGKVTDNFSNDNYFSYATDENLKVGLPNLESETAIILNKNYFETNKDGFSVVNFPDEAEKISRNLQNKVLGHTILEPNYTEDNTAVIVNATKFAGKWKEKFDRSETQKREFKNIMGKVDKRDTMWGEINSLAIENDEVSIGRKTLEGGGFVYFFSPKKYDVDSLQKLSAKIPDYIKAFSDFENGDIDDVVKGYGEVELYVPKFNISSEIDLLEVEKKLGHNQIQDGFDVAQGITNKTGQQMTISKITQVANMMIDEEEVRAEAVTDVKMEAMAAPPSDKLIIKCDRPFFAVTVSDGVISFIAFIGK